MPGDSNALRSTDRSVEQPQTIENSQKIGQIYQIDDLWTAVTATQIIQDISSTQVQFTLLPAAAKKQNRDFRDTRTATDITIQF